MFNPTRDQARLFFLNSWKKYHKEEPLSEAESLARLVAKFNEEVSVPSSDLKGGFV